MEKTLAKPLFLEQKFNHNELIHIFVKITLFQWEDLLKSCHKSLIIRLTTYGLNRFKIINYILEFLFLQDLSVNDINK